MHEEIPQSSARIPGLDLLRILSMVMVIVLHILGQGGTLNAAEKNPCSGTGSFSPAA